MFDSLIDHIVFSSLLPLLLFLFLQSCVLQLSNGFIKVETFFRRRILQMFDFLFQFHILYFHILLIIKFDIDY